MVYDPAETLVGRFGPGDGNIDFYLRVGSLVHGDSTVLDLGAGRASWFEDGGHCPTSRSIRLFKGRAKEVIAADLDPVVLANRASDRQIVLTAGGTELPDVVADVIIADYVLEHVEDVAAFAALVGRCLKPGGWFCARTPHRWNYVPVAARLIGGGVQSRLVRRLSPTRSEADVFPTFYRLNSLKALRRAFPGWDDCSFVFRAHPSYYFGNRTVYHLMDIAHRLAPTPVVGNIFAFLQKP